MSGDFPRKLVTLSEETTERGKELTQSAGIVVSVDSTAMTAQVTLSDGSANPITALVPVHAPCIADDRVAVQKFGSQWVVMAVLGVLRGLGRNGVSQAASNGTAPVGSWGNLPGAPGFSLTKRWTNTRVKWTTSVSCFTTVLGTTIQFGVTTNGGSSTVKTGHYTFANNGGDPALDAHNSTWWTYQSGLAAGTYTVTGRWQSDANIQQTSGDDWVSLDGEECV